MASFLDRTAAAAAEERHLSENTITACRRTLKSERIIIPIESQYEKTRF
jgi:hypothetical protein